MKKASKKDQIIADVIPVFVELGYSNATMRLIASRLDMNLSLITYYFDTKEKLYTSCVDKSMSTLMDFIEVRLLEPAKEVTDKQQAEEILLQSIVQYTIKALTDKTFRDYTKLLDRSLIEYDAIVNNVTSDYLEPVYSTLSKLLNFISQRQRSDRELFLQVYSLVGLATIFIRDYPFVFKGDCSGSISESDQQIVEQVISSHLKVLISTISSGI
ncbi:MAG: TetR family transcriptional regulator [Candidatus Cloacimonetes bacterium]|nr:TetR family transcriptional regulator [Candidatus Cloacimonadota bacterium]